MKAVVIDKITKAEEIFLREVEIPKVRSGWVLVKIHAFGLNRAEQILRLGEIEESYIKKPIIPGMECVGEIVDNSDSNFKIGQKIIAMMGGMGRSFNGSYAEYAILPVENVFSVETNLSWDELAAIPETYYTAYASLFACLQINKSDKILIRGATSALGYVSIQMAKAFGVKIVATTHRENKFKLLEDAGADEIILDDGNICEKVSGITKALELVGPKVVRDTLKSVVPSPQAYVCITGVLGGVNNLDNFSPIAEIPNQVYLTSFLSNTPTQKNINEMFDFINNKKLTPLIGKIFEFENIRDALIAQETGKVNGKIIVNISN